MIVYLLPFLKTMQVFPEEIKSSNFMGPEGVSLACEIRLKPSIAAFTSTILKLPSITSYYLKLPLINFLREYMCIRISKINYI